MTASAKRLFERPLAKLAAFALATVLLVALASRMIPSEKVCPDFLQFWTAATLLSSRHNPYDAASQAAIQRELVGWDRSVDGLGLYDFLPYYYPPWIGLACVPLLPLGYSLAKITWLVINAELLILAAFILKGRLPSLPRMVPILVVLVFHQSFVAVAMGQLSPLMLFLIALFWKLCDDHRDVAAGCVLALTTIKPQLTGLMILAVLLWSARQGRWGTLRGFAATLIALCLASTIISPNWPIAMAKATRVTPIPTTYYTGLGTTWVTMIKVLGARGLLAYGSYLIVAIPVLLALLRLSITRTSSLEDVLGLSLIVGFFVAPYSRPYDFPVLLIPALVLLTSRLREWAGAMLLVILIVLPYLHALWMSRMEYGQDTTKLHPEFTYFWVPVLIATAWWYSERRTPSMSIIGSAPPPPNWGGSRMTPL